VRSRFKQKDRTMNRRLITLSIAAAAAATFAGGAFAESPDPSGQFAQQVASTKSRAEVVAELKEYKRAGVNPWSMSYNPLASFKSTQTREAVVAQFLDSRDQVAAFTAEDSGSAYLARNGHQPSPDEHLAQTATPPAAQ
jgi:hypothetical protein